MTQQPVSCEGTLVRAGEGPVCVEQGPAWLVELVNSSSLIWTVAGVGLLLVVAVAGWNYYRGIEREGAASEVVWNAVFALGCLVFTAVVSSVLSTPYVVDVVLGVLASGLWAELTTRSVDVEEIGVLRQLE